jgi:hypothetical protein
MSLYCWEGKLLQGSVQEFWYNQIAYAEAYTNFQLTAFLLHHSEFEATKRTFTDVQPWISPLISSKIIYSPSMSIIKDEFYITAYQSSFLCGTNCHPALPT